ncbi:MAG: helix-turn-helix domain-containing protein [Streptococcus sp.]|nr:helix-turn-helix domain-containing protein [Streptococcus sp.]
MRNKEQGRRLVEFRKSLGMTATALGNKCGVFVGAWSQFESGRTEPHLQTFLKMKRMAQKNGVILDEYLFCSEEKRSLKSLLKLLH